jgi:hypothetical protein
MKFAHTLTPEIQKAGAAAALPHLEAAAFSQEAILPLSLIRQHTKTDDVPHVTDRILELYRNAALAAAEQYTGMLLREQRVIQQPVDQPKHLLPGQWRSHHTITLDYPTADGLIYLYGGKHAITVVTIQVAPGSTKVKIPVNGYAIDASSCCGPSSCGGSMNYGMSVMYRAGLASESDVPPCVTMGALKYIAWQINNPGDEPLPGVNQANVNPQAGRNNAAWQSGAIEEWRLCSTDA